DWAGIVMSSVDHPDQRVTLAESNSGASYSATSDGTRGYLLWLRGTTLSAQELDAEHSKLLGDPVTVPNVSAVQTAPASRSFTVSNIGTMLYNGEGDGYQLTWFDREGRVLNRIGPLQRYSSFSFLQTAR